MIFISAALQQHRSALSSIWSHLPTPPPPPPLQQPFFSIFSILPIFTAHFLFTLLESQAATHHFPSPASCMLNILTRFFIISIKTLCICPASVVLKKTTLLTIKIKGSKDERVRTHTQVYLAGGNRAPSKTNLTQGELLTLQNEAKKREFLQTHGAKKSKAWAGMLTACLWDPRRYTGWQFCPHQLV